MALPLLPLLTLFAVSAADAAVPVDVGRPMPPGTPVALVVESPGLARAAHQALFDALEAEGLDAWTVTLPSPDPAELADARAALPPDLVLVGHGIGGAWAAASAAAAPPRALVLLGAPLAPPASALLDDLHARPVPAGGLDLAALTEARWRDRRVLALLLGTPLPSLGRIDAAWLQALADWTAPVDLRALPCPLYVGMGDLDELGQPEAIRPWLPADARVVRFGRLRMDPTAFDHAALLASPRSTRAAARWLAATVAEQR
ncbi:MAG: hypothetical protein H6742_19335 [Alphaproteobacteria bacterium]|nr:hypothetical protein [Alphaproteobacteria bacterium]